MDDSKCFKCGNDMVDAIHCSSCSPVMSDKTVDLGRLPNGAHLYRKPNRVGGYTYYSDEIGGGVEVWDTSLVAESTLLTAMACEHHRSYLEDMVKKRGWKPKSGVETEQMAATGGPFVSPELMKELEARAKEKDGQ